MKKLRNSSVELLRIIAMLFIVASHCSIHGHFPDLQSLPFYNKILLAWFTLGNLGVDIFVIISGYFLCKKENTMSSIPQLHSQVIFYSFFGLIMALIFRQGISFRGVIGVCFPTLFNSYWFFTAYIILLVFTPYINKLLSCITQKQYILCLSIMLLLWVVIPTFFSQTMYGDTLPQFLMFYMIGAYLRFFPENILSNQKIAKLVCIFSFTLLFMSNVLIDLLGYYIPFFSGKCMFFYSRTSLLIVGCAVGLFCVCINNNFNCKCINKIGGCTFGVYLIHENQFIRKLLWIDWLKNYEYSHSSALLFHLVTSVIVVFLLSILIDLIYKSYIEKHILYYYKYFAKIMNVFVRTSIVKIKKLSYK